MEISLLLIATAILVCLEVFLLLRRRKRAFSKSDMRLILSEWHSIQSKVAREPGHALLEADRLLDFVLKRKGYAGQLGEKLKKAANEFNHIDSIWAAHKLRNRVVHEAGFSVNEGQVRDALHAFKKALWDLGIKHL